MMYRVSLLITGSVLLLLSFTPLASQAQKWAQEAEVVTTIHSDGPLNVFLDSLYQKLDQHPETHVRRSPEDSMSRSYRLLRKELYQEGVALPSASHAFIRYRFDLTKDGQHVVETIQDIHFTLRLHTGEDLSILYVKLEEPLIRKYMNTRGIQSEMNLKNHRTFRNHMTFPVLSTRSSTEMIAMGGEVLRGVEESSQKQRLLLELFRSRGYALDSDSYALPTPSLDQTSASR